MKLLAENMPCFQGAAAACCDELRVGNEVGFH
jgi:hypothetical protein